LSDFRYALESGRNSDIALCPFGAGAFNRSVQHLL